MKVGIIGLPEVGKTTLFNALTRSNAEVHAYGAHKDEVNLGYVPVPDERFDLAVRLCAPKKQVPAGIDVTDGGARISLDQARPTQFGADFFAGVRNMDTLLLTLRAFSSPSIPDPDDGISPVRDAERIMQELILADLTVVEGRLERLAKNRQSRRLTAADAAEEQVLIKVRTHLEELQPARTLQLDGEEERSIRSFAFVSAKPLLVAVNTSEGQPSDPALAEQISAALGVEGRVVELCASIEAEIAQMGADEEREFLEALGVSEPARNRLVRAAYAALGYISFFTVGPDEVRAWTIRRGTTAVGAAEKIHSDIARTFIRAEVMPFEEFRAAGGWDEARAAGKMRLEGKEYVVEDGDIVHIRNSKG